MTVFYRLVTNETPGLCLGMWEEKNLKQLFQWAKENSWTPARFEDDPEADCVIQRLEPVNESLESHPVGKEELMGTAYRLPLDKIKFIADLPNTQPDPEIFTPEVMAKDLELLAGQSPEFVLGFASAVDCVMGSFEKFMELSYTADVPVIMFEKIMLTMAVTACQKYLKDKEP